MPAFRAAEDPSDALPHIDGNIFIRRRSERKLTPRITKMKSRGIKARARKADAKHLNKCRGIRRRETQSGSPTTASIAWTEDRAIIVSSPQIVPCSAVWWIKLASADGYQSCLHGTQLARLRRILPTNKSTRVEILLPPYLAGRQRCSPCLCRSTCTRTLHLLASLRSPAGDVCSHTNQKTVSANAERQRASTGEKGET